jgi:two-component system cell cycle sensor histidine kinase/response regulator CckA
VGQRSRPDRDQGGDSRERTTPGDPSRLRDALEFAADAVLLVDREGRIHEAAGASSDMFGRSPDALRGDSAATLCLPAARDRLIANLERAAREGRHLFSTQIIRGDGEVVPVEISARRSGSSAEGLLLCIVRDITGRALSFPVERLELENEIRKMHLQLLQSQKLEAVGLLASGMAHDFNNLLNVIMGYGELLGRSLPEADSRRGRIEHILEAAQRAGTLTRSLLAFGRKPVQQARVVDLNLAVRETEWMLRRLIGEDVELELRLSEDIGNIKVDPGQLEQVLLNLAVNARHAMQRGGALILATDNADPERPPGEPPPPPGGHIRLTMTDTGVGMDAETQARIFEPFFTTRPGEEGTGLGLATVSGIVQQSGGVIEVESEPGHGTTFRIYLPRVDEAPQPGPGAAPSRPGPRGHETLLLAEDQGALRDMIQEALQLLGYRVLVAPHGEAAIGAARRHRGRLDLLITDVVMPRLDGCELARRLSAERPGLRVLYMSGHGIDTATRRGMVEGSTLLEKPFTTEALSLRVREALDRPLPSEG